MYLKLKIISWKLFKTFSFKNNADYLIFDVFRPWHYWKRNKRSKYNLCKFYSLTDTLKINNNGECYRNNYGIESLKDCYWYSSIASTFNDIADCNPELLSISNIRKLYKIYKESAIRDNAGVISIDEFKQMLITEQLKVFNDNSGITCFSHAKNIKSHLMWAHYADEHKGVCIKFKSPELFSERILLPAVYVRRKPKILLEDVVHFLPLIKSVCWKYEKEVRLISFRIRNDNRKIPFKPSQVLEIYLGVRFKENENKQEILEIISDKYPNAKLFQMRLNEKNIKLIEKAVSIVSKGEIFELKSIEDE